MTPRKYVLYMACPETHSRYFIRTRQKGNLYVEMGQKEEALVFDADEAIFLFNYYRQVLTTLRILEL